MVLTRGGWAVAVAVTAGCLLAPSAALASPTNPTTSSISPTASPTAGPGAAPTGVPTPGAPAPVPSPPACANAVQVVTGTVTSPPSPLPRPTSTVGGARLSAPGLQVDRPAGVPAPPVLPAAGWIVADLGTGDVLAACNAHVPFLPASTIKVLTGLALEPAVDRRQTYVALPADAAVDGTKVGLSPGSTYTGDDLFHALLMSSGNDAANALADLAGGMPQATTLMAAEARRLGALDTVPLNTSGLDAPGQQTSAYDLALLGRAALARPYLATVMTTRSYRFPGKGVGQGKARDRYEIQNHNRLLGSYRGATGVKNGFTEAAGGTFVGSASRGGRSYVAAVLRADGRTAPMAARLLDWAFAHGTALPPVGRLVTPQEVAAGLSSPSGSPSPSPTPSGTATPTSTPTGAGSAIGPTGATQGSAAETWAAVLVLGTLLMFAVGGVLLVRIRDR